MEHLASVLGGALSLASLVAALFFLKFWHKTGDTFFLYFSAAFAIDAVARFAVATLKLADASEPVFFIPRLLTFGLIALSIIAKNITPTKPK